MKKIILSTLLSLPLFFLAQTSKKLSSANLLNREKQIVYQKKLEADEVFVSYQKYKELKSKGLLTKEKIDPTTLPQIKIIPPKNTPLKLAVLSPSTPCDDIPYVGSSLTYTNSSLPDDDAGTNINLPFGFCFYGNTYNTCYLSINGNIQFGTTDNGYTAAGFPSTTVNMIAPFWADIDFNGVGQILVDMSVPTRVVFSWDSVGRYNSLTDKVNSFQLVITDGIDGILPPGKNVGFYYKKMQWANSGAAGFGVNPSTVGINAGDGINFFQIGTFNQLGLQYDGPNGANDGVKWLEGKRFYFNVCPPLGSNIEPVSTQLGYCNTYTVCGNDSLIIQNTFIGPEATQQVTVTATAASLGSAFSFSSNVNINGGTDIDMIIDGNLATAGNHIVTMTAIDNGTPALTSTQSFVVFVNQGAVNNLNASIAVSPTLGSCPGGVVNASVSISGGMPDTYLWNNGNITANTTFTTIIPADSLIYVTITSGQCSKTIFGNININPVPIASITGNLAFCDGAASSTSLTAVNGLNPSSSDTYVWASSAATSTLSSTSTKTVEVNAGVYTVTITNQFGCVSVASTSVTANSTPNFTLNSTNAISGGSVYCLSQDTARIDILYSGGAPSACGLANSPCVISNIIQVGNATTQGLTNVYTPYEGAWESAKHQYLIRASEMIAAGVLPGKLSSLAFKVTNLNANSNTFDNFSIKLKCVSNTILTTAAMDNAGLVQVFGPSNITATVGINTYNFSQSYLWDGTSNLLVDVCFFNQAWDGNLSVEYTNVGYNATRNVDADNIDQCPLSTVDGLSNNRPNIRFGNCLAQQIGSQFNVSVNPSAGVVIPTDNETINIALPTTVGTICYTVTLTNPIGGCSKDTVICVQATQGTTQATLTASNYTVCPSQTVTLSALGTLTSYTINYVGDAGAGSSINSPVTFNAPVANGAYVYTLVATGQCGGTLTAFTNTVNVTSGVTIANLVITPDSVCPSSQVTLSASGPILPTYTISYVNGAGLQTIVGNSVTVTPTLTTRGYQTYTLTAQGACGGPITNFTDSVKIYTLPTTFTLTPTNQTVCPGAAITVNYSGSLTTHTISYHSGASILTATTMPVTFVPSSTANPVFGWVTYTVSANGPCGGNTVIKTDSVFIEQGISAGQLFINGLATPNQTVCPSTNVSLSAVGASSTLTTYTILYNNGAGVQTSNAPVNFTLPAATASLSVYIYTLVIKGPCSASLVTVTNTLVVKQGTTNAIPIATPSLACIGNTVTLSANQGSFTTYTITYNNGLGNVVAPANTNPNFVTNTASTNNLFTVTAQGTCGAPIQNFIGTYTVQQKINLTPIALQNATKCFNGSALLSANIATSTAQPYTYLWVPSAGVTTQTLNTTTAGIYSVTVNGVCANALTQTVIVTDFAHSPIATILDSTSVCANTELVLHSTVNGGRAPYAFSWSIVPNATTVGTAINLNTTAPNTEGTYTIMVVVTDSCGFNNFDTQLITVLPPCTIEIGNVITPNGDGVNDVFKIKNLEYYPNSVFTVFDRWGKKVYENANYQNDWKGDGLHDGTFFYVLDVPSDKKYNGYFTVITNK